MSSTLSASFLRLTGDIADFYQGMREYFSNRTLMQGYVENARDLTQLIGEGTRGFNPVVQSCLGSGLAVAEKLGAIPIGIEDWILETARSTFNQGVPAGFKTLISTPIEGFISGGKFIGNQAEKWSRGEIDESTFVVANEISATLGVAALMFFGIKAIPAGRGITLPSRPAVMGGAVLSSALLAGCGDSDRPDRAGVPDRIRDGSAGGASQNPSDAGIADAGRPNEFGFLDGNRVQGPPDDMWTWRGLQDGGEAAPEAGIDFVPTHRCRWAQPVRITDYPADHDRDPGLVATGRDDVPFGVAWRRSSQIFFQTLDAQGSSLSGEVQLSSAIDAGMPRVAFDGANFAVVWHENDLSGGVPKKVEFRLVDLQGVPGPAATLVAGGALASNPVVTPLTAGWSVLWGDGRLGAAGIYGSLLTPQGTVSLAERPLTVSPQGSIRPASAWTGTELGAGWMDNRDGNQEIYFARFDGQLGPIGSELRQTNDGGASYEPSLVWTGNAYGLGWLDQRDGADRVYFRPLDSQGNPLSPDRVLSPPDASSVSLAWQGSLLGALWAVGNAVDRELQFQLLDSLGTPLSEPALVTINLQGASDNPPLVWSGRAFATAWEDTQAVDREIYFATIDCNDADAL